MRVISTISSALVLLTAGCGPSPDVRAIESKAQALVANKAATNDVAAAFARAPIHIYTRAEAIQQLSRTSPQDKSVHKFWERLSQHPHTHSFPLPGGEVLIFFDESGDAVGYYSNIQL